MAPNGPWGYSAKTGEQVSWGNGFSNDPGANYQTPAEKNSNASMINGAAGAYGMYEAGSGMLGSAPTSAASSMPWMTGGASVPTSVPMGASIPAGYSGIATDAATGATQILPSSMVAPSAGSIFGLGGAGTDSAILGQGITSGLGSLGVGAETAASIGGVAGTAIPAIAGAYGLYNMGENLFSGTKMGTAGGAMRGAGTGAAIGSIVPGVGTLIGAGVGALAGGVLGQFGHGPNYYAAKEREKAFGQIFDGNTTRTLKNGQTINLANDEEIHNYNIDHSNPVAADAIPYFKAIARAFAPAANENVHNALVGRMYNEMTKGGTIQDPAEIRRQILRLVENLGLTPSQSISNIDSLLNQGLIAQEERDVLIGRINNLRPGNSYMGNVGQGGSGGGTPAPTPAPTPEAQPGASEEAKRIATTTAPNSQSLSPQGIPTGGVTNLVAPGTPQRPALNSYRIQANFADYIANDPALRLILG